MLHLHGSPAAVIAGSSTHNECIERLWRDMYRCVCCHYYELFYAFEEEEILNSLNETDLYCLHYVFLPRINKHLDDFVESWNHHSLSTEHNQTPYQLMSLGLESSQRRVTPDVRVGTSQIFQNTSTLLSMCKYHAPSFHHAQLC